MAGTSRYTLRSQQSTPGQVDAEHPVVCSQEAEGTALQWGLVQGHVLSQHARAMQGTNHDRCNLEAIIACTHMLADPCWDKVGPPTLRRWPEEGGNSAPLRCSMAAAAASALE